MHILIICDPIVPPSYAPRVTATYRYLIAEGHECVLEAGTIPTYSSKWQYICHLLLDKLFRWSDRQFGKKLYRKYSSAKFDVILCSSYYYFPLWTARFLSNKWHIPYVVDLRDIAEQWGDTPYFTTTLPHLLGIEKCIAKLYETHNIRFRNRVLQHAKAVVSVSPWHCEWLRTQTDTPVHLIYNGYDEAEMHFEARPTPVFSIAYIGRIIKLSLRQPQLLLQAIGELHNAGTISPQQVQVNFYAEPHMESAVSRMATHYGAQDYLHWHTYVDRSQLNNIMSQSSILVALACPPKHKQHGILGTKVFEAIGTEKPLLLVPSDEDSLARLITETGIGIAARNVDEIKQFIVEKYHEWKENGYTRQTIQNKDLFNRQYLAHGFETLLHHSANL
ncbi:MAG: glycosyltransferase [Paludibacteraceae bacterium]|nr:glycosyltransferase [Paludibacteraceae bacterium]